MGLNHPLELLWHILSCYHIITAMTDFDIGYQEAIEAAKTDRARGRAKYDSLRLKPDKDDYELGFIAGWEYLHKVNE